MKFNPKVLGAIDKYKELSETSAVKLLKAARSSVSKLEQYFRTIDLNLLDDHGKPIYHAKDLITNLEKMGKVVNGLEELEEIVKNNPSAYFVDASDGLNGNFKGNMFIDFVHYTEVGRRRFADNIAKKISLVLANSNRNQH